MKNLIGFLAVLVVFLVGLACNDADLEKANGLVREANKFITTGNENIGKADKKYGEYVEKVNGIKSDDDLEKARSFGKELFPLFDSVSDDFKKASEKFDEASKLKVNEKFKEYLEAKSKEFKARADYGAEMKKIPQALIDSKNKAGYEEERDKIKEKADKFLREAKEFDEKAEKIRSENPTIFKN